MAVTALYSATPGSAPQLGNNDNYGVTTAITATANVSTAVELRVNAVATVMDGGTRGLTREEVLEAVQRIMNEITDNPWPPT